MHMICPKLEVGPVKEHRIIYFLAPTFQFFFEQLVNTLKN